MAKQRLGISALGVVEPGGQRPLLPECGRYPGGQPGGVPHDVGKSIGEGLAIQRIAGVDFAAALPMPDETVQRP